MAISRLSLVAAGLLLLLLAASLPSCSGRKHHLERAADSRRFFPISTFGFFTGGFLAVNVTNFRVIEGLDQGEEEKGKSDGQKTAGVVLDPTDLTLGFSIDKTTNDALNPYVETSEERCILGPERLLPNQTNQDAILRFKLNFAQNKTEVECSSNIQSINIFTNRDKLKEIAEKNAAHGHLSDSHMFQPMAEKDSHLSQRARRDNHDVLDEMKEADSKVSSAPDQAAAHASESNPLENNKCKNVNIALNRHVNDQGEVVFNTSFFIYIANEKEEGLYSLYFHNCHNYNDESKVHVSFVIDIEEKNNNSYLSAGEMPLPALYLLMSVLFFLSGCFWIFILRKNGTEQVFRIHWVMAALVFLKSLSLFFHGINYQKIETHGYHIESWAVLYYITHLLKGGLLFFTIVLIGSGWAFVKHILSDKEKRVFMVVLPLQVIANVAYIIIEESEEGEARHNWWKEIFILVDLLCCGAILFPVVWSIRHLQEASRTDGKASISLAKLKLFRHFYVMVVCYIYFTRIIVYLLKITVPFQYEWLDETFKEMATFVFFVMTGYKFRPASNNPYFAVPIDDDNDLAEEGEVLIGSTLIGETVTSRKNKKRALVDDDDESDDAEGMVFFPTSKTESSHELD